MSQNPELDQLYIDLRAAVEKQVQEFWNKYKTKVGQEIQKSMAASMPVSASSTSSSSRPALASGLPWFQHGLRGFLQKLWYGNHPDNPNWKGVKAESFSLHEYNDTRSELRNLVVEAIGDVEADSLVSSLMSTIVGYLGKASDVIKKTESPVFHPMIKYNPRANAGEVISDTPSEEIKTKKPRGRPRKIQEPTTTTEPVSVDTTPEISELPAPQEKKPRKPRLQKINNETPPVDNLPGSENAPKPEQPAAKEIKKPISVKLGDEDYKELAGKYYKAHMRSAEENPSNDGRVQMSDEMKGILKQAGAQFDNNGELKDSAITAKALVELTYQMSQIDDADYWQDPDYYMDFYGVQSDKKIRKMIMTLADEKLDSDERDWNPDNDNQFDNRENYLIKLKKMLRENKKEDKIIFESKKVPNHLKTKFFLEALKNR